MTDWDKLIADIPQITANAAVETNEELASRISSLLAFKEDDINKLVPEPKDKEKLITLMQIVKSAENSNDKISKIVDNIDNLGGVLLKVLGTI